MSDAVIVNASGHDRKGFKYMVCCGRHRRSKNLCGERECETPVLQISTCLAHICSDQSEVPFSKEAFDPPNC